MCPAATLGQAGKAMPNTVLQLVRTLAAMAVPGHAFVTIHESGSTDDTRAWLDLLQLLLVPLGVPLHLEVDGPAFDPQSISRAGFVAAARNAALRPFFPPDAGDPQALRAAPCDLPSCWAPAYVVFFDAVYFCAADVLRLMQVRAGSLGAGGGGRLAAAAARPTRPPGPPPAGPPTRACSAIVAPHWRAPALTSPPCVRCSTLWTCPAACSWQSRCGGGAAATGGARTGDGAT
jgi:hypothetical protein